MKDIAPILFMTIPITCLIIAVAIILVQSFMYDSLSDYEMGQLATLYNLDMVDGETSEVFMGRLLDHIENTEIDGGL